MLNRKGHLPTFLLIPAAIVLCLVAWHSFLTFNNLIEAQRLVINSLISDNSYIDSYVHANAYWLLKSAYWRANTFGLITPDQVHEHLRLMANDKGASPLATNFFGKLRSGDFTVTADKGTYLLTVSNVSLFPQRGVNEIHRSFDLTVTYTP